MRSTDLYKILNKIDSFQYKIKTNLNAVRQSTELKETLC